MKWRFKHNDKPQTPARIRKDLEEAERFGNMAVREVCTAALEKQEPDYNQLLMWAQAILDAADCAHSKGSKDLTGTYLFLYHNLWEYAKNHLSLEEYHHFCGKQMDCWQYLCLE